jgi:hypothetical protein
VWLELEADLIGLDPPLQAFGRNQVSVEVFPPEAKFQVSAKPVAAEAASLIESETENESRLGVIQRSSFNKTSFI